MLTRQDKEWHAAYEGGSIRARAIIDQAFAEVLAAFRVAGVTAGTADTAEALVAQLTRYYVDSGNDLQAFKTAEEIRAEFTTDHKGEAAGRPGWTRVLRRGIPIFYGSQEEAETYIARRVRREAPL
ncbi:MAG TPA: hypothetical protein VFA39_15800 [Steroidobacteraceae bacterium]|nr:hypothetical protein [Steroidobacteraceae bacterium]